MLIQLHSRPSNYISYSPTYQADQMERCKPEGAYHDRVSMCAGRMLMMEVVFTWDWRNMGVAKLVWLVSDQYVDWR